MKILHTADWHLGKKLEGYSRLPEQKDVLDEICKIAQEEKPDAILISGDVYDTYNPPIEAVELFYKTVKSLSRNASIPVFVIAGNHDSPDRIEAVDPLAVENGIFLLGFPDSTVRHVKLDSGLEVIKSEPGFVELKLVSTNEKLRVLFTPYANEIRLKTALNMENPEEELKQLLSEKWNELAEKYCDSKGVNILMSHNFFIKKGEKPVEDSDDEKPILYVGGAQAMEVDLIPGNIQYTALGHLHRYQNVNTDSSPVIYSGSPLSYSFAEAGQDKFIVISDVLPGKTPDVRRVKLNSGKKLLRKKFDNIDDAVLWLNENQDTLLELTIKMDDFLSSTDRQRLYSAHDGIISIIPEIKNITVSEEKILDLEQSMEKLFEQYFYFKKGQTPNNRIKKLFKEIIS
ncbi:MAG TPA: exonuclease subunit SbcD [Bacteroidetes bacterium]|nr:exonuclease subunit SbcD [Bacteroidota bacterium]